MFYLLLAVLSSALVSLLMRLSEEKIRSNVGLLAVNYLMCAAMAGGFAAQAGPLFSAAEGMGRTVAMGLIGGFLFAGCFVLLQWNIAKNGVVLASTFMKLGVLVPALLSVAVFRETPGVWQFIGFAGACLAIALIHFDGGGGRAAHRVGLLLLVLGGGAADGMMKIYEELGRPELKNHFLFYIFLTALLVCLGIVLAKKQRIGGWELLFGALIGIPNYFSSRFLLLSLSHVPAVVAYPAFSVATIVAVTAVGVLFFKEKLSRRKKQAMALILVCLVLLNL